jgi:hypothetical protein
MNRDAWKYAGKHASGFIGESHAHADVAENLRLYGRIRRDVGYFDASLLPKVEDLRLPPKLDNKSESQWVKAWVRCQSAPVSRDTLYNRTCANRRRAGFRP